MEKSERFGFHLPGTENVADGTKFAENWIIADEKLGEVMDNVAEIKDGAVFKNNETEFMPTKDYHPAPKKYVDDSINSIYTYGTEDLIAGESKLETGKLHFVYE